MEMMNEIFSAADLRMAAAALTVAAIDYSAVVTSTLIDLATGVAKARRGQRPVTSRGFRRTVGKLAVYLTVMGGLTAVDVMIAGGVWCLRLSAAAKLPIVPALTTLGAIGLVGVEIKSICENSRHRALLTAAESFVENLFNRLKALKK